MADQAANAGGRSSIDPPPETSAAGAPAPGAAVLGNAPAAAASAVSSEAPAAAASDTQTVEESRARVEPGGPGFGERGRMRRRLRFLRKARELAYRDLGGLVYEMQRLGERRDELAAAKLATLAAIDTELRALESALGDRRALTILRESGIAACPRCAAIHGSDDRFCPSCGLAMERRAERPIAVAAPTGPGAGAGATAGTAAATAASPAAARSASAAATPVVPPAPAPAPAPAPVEAPAPPRAPFTPLAPPARHSPVTAPVQPFTPPAPPPGSGSGSAPPPPGSGSAPGPPQPAADDRPTEIIRPADAGSRGEA